MLIFCLISDSNIWLLESDWICILPDDVVVAKKHELYTSGPHPRRLAQGHNPSILQREGQQTGL